MLTDHCFETLGFLSSDHCLKEIEIFSIFLFKHMQNNYIWVWYLVWGKKRQKHWHLKSDYFLFMSEEGVFQDFCLQQI